jgi:hypothetical protein
MLERIGLALLLCAFAAVAGLFSPTRVLGADKEPKVYIVRLPGGDWIRAYTEPCPVATGWLGAQMKRAQWRFNGRIVDGCWRIVKGPQQPYVLILDADGDSHTQPAKDFSVDVGT